MGNWKMNRAVRWAVSGAVDWAVWQTVPEAVSDAVWWAVRQTVDDAVSVGVDDDVYGAVGEDPAHPGLQDFLNGLGEA